MRGAFLVGVALALAAVAACGASNDGEATRPADADGGGNLVSHDGGSTEAATTEAGTNVSMCSAAGWCVTDLPDEDLKVKDVWPLDGRAFALVESGAIGVKVLEWVEASSTWSYIDDNTQNESGYGKYVGNIWSPGANEVYYAVAPATIYHGTRSSPGATWTWERRRLDDLTNYSSSVNDPSYPYDVPSGVRYPALGVRGTSRDDVYAWYVNAIYRWKAGPGGAPDWIVEHVLGDFDPIDPQIVLSAGGTQPDDVWFAGGRGNAGSCGLLLRKTASGYERVADGVSGDPTGRRCAAKDGLLKIDGWLTDVQALRRGEVFATGNTLGVVRLSVLDDGYSVATASPPETVARAPWSSIWAASADRFWLSRVGSVIQGDDVWSDAGVYRISTIAQNGAPLLRAFYRVRGTSNTNLWLVGDGYALHKTTP